MPLNPKSLLVAHSTWTRLGSMSRFCSFAASPPSASVFPERDNAETDGMVGSGEEFAKTDSANLIGDKVEIPVFTE